jgi:hypothetical protein
VPLKHINGQSAPGRYLITCATELFVAVILTNRTLRAARSPVTGTDGSEPLAGDGQIRPVTGFEFRIGLPCRIAYSSEDEHSPDQLFVSNTPATSIERIGNA